MLLTDQVYSALHEAILSGALPAGSRLKVRDLAEQVGTSVMPVREAIRRLEEAGLAERKPHKGAVVVELTLEELAHIYDVRLILEREAARLGAAAISSGDCDAMEVALRAMKDAINEHEIAAYLDQDETFLEILYSAGGNPVLVTMIKALWQRSRAYRIVSAQRLVDRDSHASLWRHAEVMLAAARTQEAAEAASVAEASLLAARQGVKDLLATQD